MATIKTKGADEALRRTESIVESAAQAILAVGPDGKIVLANAMTEKMFGYSRAELLGNPAEGANRVGGSLEPALGDTAQPCAKCR